MRSFVSINCIGFVRGSKYKSGKKTFGLDRFFSSVLPKSVPGLAFFTLSLVSTKERRAFRVRLEQVMRTEEEKQEIAQHRRKAKSKKAGANASDASAPRKAGRPKGSKNKNRTDVALRAELQRIKQMLQGQLQRIGGCLPVAYLALDGHFGHNSALQMTRQCGLHLISKLRSNAVFY